MKTLLYALILLLPFFFLQAQEEDRLQQVEHRLEILEKKLQVLHWKRPSTVSNWVKKGYDITFSGSAFIWNAKQEGLESFVTNEEGGEFLSSAKTESIDFNWDWGFRLAMNYQTPRHRMDLNLMWTRFYTDGGDKIAEDAPGAIFSIWSAPSAILSAGDRASDHWRMRLNLLNLEVGGQFFPKKWLQIRPHMGFSSAWIDQHLDATLNGAMSGALPASSHIAMQNDFFGAGLRGGMNTAWGLSYGLSFYGDAAFSILYGCFDVRQKEKLEFASLQSSSEIVDEKEHFRLSRIILELGIGIRWDRFFAKERYHLGLQAGWEELYFFGQNQLRHFFSDQNLGASIAEGGDLTLQGWTFRASLGF